MGWLGAWAQKSMLIGFFMFYCVLVSVWASVWYMVPEATMKGLGLTYVQVVWYFIFTELLMFSTSHLYREIEEDIRSGQMTMFFVRPVSYVLLKGAEWLGYSCLRASFLFPLVLLLGFALTREFVLDMRALVMLPVMIFCALFIWMMFQIVIGLTAAWVQSARPVNMIFQKTAFVLGGLLVPITYYPDFLQIVAWMTPFPAILYAPASVVLNSDWPHIYAMLALQGLWMVLSLIVVALIKSGFEDYMLKKGEL